jgi:hypothetical protein
VPLLLVSYETKTQPTGAIGIAHLTDGDSGLTRMRTVARVPMIELGVPFGVLAVRGANDDGRCVSGVRFGGRDWMFVSSQLWMTTA